MIGELWESAVGNCLEAAKKNRPTAAKGSKAAKASKGAKGGKAAGRRSGNAAVAAVEEAEEVAVIMENGAAPSGGSAHVEIVEIVATEDDATDDATDNAAADDDDHEVELVAIEDVEVAFPLTLRTPPPLDDAEAAASTPTGHTAAAAAGFPPTAEPPFLVPEALDATRKALTAEAAEPEQADTAQAEVEALNEADEADLAFDVPPDLAPRAETSPKAARKRKVRERTPQAAPRSVGKRTRPARSKLKASKVLS